MRIVLLLVLAGSLPFAAGAADKAEKAAKASEKADTSKTQKAKVDPAVAKASAEKMKELIRIHTQALGGAARIEKLAAIRATGVSGIAGKAPVRFTLTAARPAKIRLETEAGGRTLVQGWDGVEPAWEFDTLKWPPQYRAMAKDTAHQFTTDAEFDDALIAGEKRGYTLEYGGEIESEGQKVIRVTVRRKAEDAYVLLLDSRTSFIVARVETREGKDKQKTQVITRLENYLPVDGVMMPHLVTVVVDGKPVQQTKMEKIAANPALTAETFSRPKSQTGKAAEEKK
ncbi:MAG TPA: hypothetical protein VGE76_23095 [Opitutaceae bacterium]